MLLPADVTVLELSGGKNNGSNSLDLLEDVMLEEIDAAEFMSVDQAKNGIMFSQYPILNVLQSNGLA